MPVDNLTLKIQLEGINALEDTVNQAVTKLSKVVPEGFRYQYLEKQFTTALHKAAEQTVSTKINEVAGKTLEAATKPAEKHVGMFGKIFGTMGAGLRSVATGMTGGVVDFTKGSSASGAAKGAGSATGVGAAGVAGAIAGVNILQKIADILMGLAPIAALIKVITTIMQLALLPLALVLMAILMPFLLPLLQLLGKFPWKEFFIVTQAMSAFISKYMPYIIDVLFPIVGIYNLVMWLAPIVANLLGRIFSWFVGVLGVDIAALKVVFAAVYNWLASAFGPVIIVIKEAIGNVLGAITSIWDWFSGTMSTVFGGIYKAVTGAWNILQSVWNWFSGTMGTALNTIVSVLNVIANVIGGVLKAANPSNWGGAIIGGIESLATGGSILSSGLVMVHAGETVLPAGTTQIAGGAQPQITVYVTGNSITKDVDINALANQVAQAMSNKARLMRTW